MLVYEHEHTQDVVARLMGMAKLLRLVIPLIAALVFGVLFAVLAGLISPLMWWLGAIIGGFIGYGIGAVGASLYVLVIEWMAQMLVAQGEILVELKNADKTG